MDASNLRLRPDSKAEMNKRRREYYASNKEKINKRRRELYAAYMFLNVQKKKKLTTRTNEVNQTTDAINSSNKLIEIDGKDHKQKQDSPTTSVTDGLLSNLQRKQSLTNENDFCLTTNGLERNSRLINNHEKGHGQELIDATTAATSLIKFLNDENGSSSVLRDQTLLHQTDFHPARDGAISLTGSVLLEYLVQLITGNDEKSKNFQNMIRTYNNSFAFTSIGISCDEQYERRDRGIYTVRVQGQIHHYLDDLIPQNASRKLSGIQFYIYDPDHQVTNRMMTLPRLYAAIVGELVELLKSNPYSEFIRRAFELENIDHYHIVIRADPGLDQRTYNLPTSTEVAGIWTEDESGEYDNSKLWDIIVYTKSGRSYKVQCFYGCYDPLQYVLMFPKGET